MKLAVLADPHANLIALHAVITDLEAWKPDRVIVGGDLVNRGPRPAECLRRIQEKQQAEGWLVVRGNHEDYVIASSQLDSPRSGARFEAHRPSFWTLQRIGGDVSQLAAMPFQVSLTDPSGGMIRVTHGSMLGMRDGVYPETTDDELGEKVGIPPAVFIVGHTHRPLVRWLNGTLVVNAGSAGLPFDGDPRPTYARLTYQSGGWKAEIVRIDYDRQQAENDFYESGYLEEAGPLTELVLTELRTARSLLYGWAVQYQSQAEEGLITMRQSVDQFLSGL
jgi:predicted phosphodiesterase